MFAQSLLKNSQDLRRIGRCDTDVCLSIKLRGTCCARRKTSPSFVKARPSAVLPLPCHLCRITQCPSPLPN